MKGEGDYFGKALKGEILRFIILNHLSQHEGYPYALMKAIHHKKVWILRGATKSDCYNAMNALEKQGFIRGKLVLKGAMAQKHYVLTPKGKRVVKQSIKIMRKGFKEASKLMRERLNE